ncbi:T-cell leukemia translocation-altered gene protein isoform X1 [Myotis lucifugus]|uniref:T-cell leukemia translocation-altered gene protein isoform X1 n=1 Tax=Myotis lucifugus TaxID=59463 RepID=UPI000CCBE5E0|nr:T-cell leukemia translocation-altered gene protein isoform X1 [Myotis lucifugus]
MAESWSGQSLQALPATALGALGALGSEFLREWEAQDMRVTLFKLLLLWLLLSLLCIQLAWGFYGSTVTGLYHRPDPQRGPRQLWMCSCPQVWAARTDPHPTAPRISLRVSEMKWQVPGTALHCKPRRWKGRASVLPALTASSGSTCSSVKHGPSRQGILSANLWAPTTWQGPENKGDSSKRASQNPQRIREAAEGLQGHLRVCRLPHWVLLLPRPQG